MSVLTQRSSSSGISVPRPCLQTTQLLWHQQLRGWGGADSGSVDQVAGVCALVLLWLELLHLLLIIIVSH